MTNLLFIGDLHYSGVNPENYISDYREDFKAQMHEVYELALRHKVEAILTPGDVFNSHTVSNSVLLELHDILNQSPVKWCTIIGNHDIIGYNVESYQRSSLRLVAMICDRIKSLDVPMQLLDQKETSTGYIQITGTHYSNQTDVNGYGYEPAEMGELLPHADIKIHLSHGMLLDHVPPFERYTHIKDVETTADIVLCGHDHTGFGTYYRTPSKSLVKCGTEFKWEHSEFKGVVFCNPGAFMRQKASEAELTRTVKVALISIDADTASIELIPLKSAKPGAEVLSRKAIEESKAREYAMSEFSALIQSKTGEATILDTLQVIQEIGQAEGVPDAVTQKALKLVEERRGKV